MLLWWWRLLLLGGRRLATHLEMGRSVGRLRLLRLVRQDAFENVFHVLAVHIGQPADRVAHHRLQIDVLAQQHARQFVSWLQLVGHHLVLQQLRRLLRNGLSDYCRPDWRLGSALQIVHFFFQQVNSGRLFDCSDRHIIASAARLTRFCFGGQLVAEERAGLLQEIATESWIRFSQFAFPLCGFRLGPHRVSTSK